MAFVPQLDRLGGIDTQANGWAKLFDEEGNATELVSKEVVRRIEEKQAPWFIYVGFHAVHTPVDAPDEYKRIYDGVKFHNDPEKQDSRLRMAAMEAACMG